MTPERAPATEVVSGGVSFEVERFEWTDGERLEVTGRWYGLRGHRFVRPALTIEAEDGRRRMLAILEHKPWAADDGEPWVAAFPWEGEPIEIAGAELAVAPSLAVDLPAPRIPGQRRKTARPNGPRPARRSAGKADEASASAQADEQAPEAAELDALRAQLTAEQQAVRRLAAELDDAHARLAAATGAADDRAALERERDVAIAERDDARARAALDHDAVTEERDEALRARVAAHQERDEALDQRAASDWERKAAIAERDAAVAERDRVVEAHRAAVRELEAVERRAAEREPVAPAPAPTEPPVRPGLRRHRLAHEQTALVVWGKRLAALVVLALWALVVYTVLHGVV